MPQLEGLRSPSSAVCSRSLPVELSLPGLGLQAEAEQGTVTISKEPIIPTSQSSSLSSGAVLRLL